MCVCVIPPEVARSQISQIGDPLNAGSTASGRAEKPSLPPLRGDISANYVNYF